MQAKTILDFRALMQAAHLEARQYLTDVIELWDELNGTYSDQLDISPDWSTGLVITPLRNNEAGLPVPRPGYYHYAAITAEGIWAYLQDTSPTGAEFFPWDSLDHENDVLGVAEFVQGIAMRLFTSQDDEGRDSFDQWQDYQLRLGRRITVG